MKQTGPLMTAKPLYSDLMAAFLHTGPGSQHSQTIMAAPQSLHQSTHSRMGQQMSKYSLFTLSGSCSNTSVNRLDSWSPCSSSVHIGRRVAWSPMSGFSYLSFSSSQIEILSCFLPPYTAHSTACASTLCLPMCYFSPHKGYQFLFPSILLVLLSLSTLGIVVHPFLLPLSTGLCYSVGTTTIISPSSSQQAFVIPRRHSIPILYLCVPPGQWT